MNVMLNTVLRDLPANAKSYSPLHLVPDAKPAKALFENIAVVGLGYVGLPLAVCLADKFAHVTGVDISEQRVADLIAGVDATGEISRKALLNCGLTVSSDVAGLAAASFYIVTVPTPITAARQPDLSPLQSACEMIGPHLKVGDVVVFESTVYPGVTEDICGPLLEKFSGLKASTDFGLGYSPERINPGDRLNTVENVIKVISGDTEATLDRVRAVYNSVIDAGLYACPSIRVAEAAKVLENTQRDINIALMNEMSLICDKIGIATNDVIDAAATKWNFVPFTPGLVGGHCIGVDPYYLASLAEQIGHHPQVILAGRRTNDGMVGHIADTALRLMIAKGGSVRDMRVGLFGITFKENVPDIRNSKAVELYHALCTYGITPLVHDSECPPEVARAAGIELSTSTEMQDLDVMLLATPHQDYLEDQNFLGKVRDRGILIDVRGAYRKDPRVEALTYWSL